MYLHRFAQGIRPRSRRRAVAAPGAGGGICGGRERGTGRGRGRGQGAQVRVVSGEAGRGRGRGRGRTGDSGVNGNNGHDGDNGQDGFDGHNGVNRNDEILNANVVRILDDELSRLVNDTNEECSGCLMSDDTVSEWRSQMIDVHALKSWVMNDDSHLQSSGLKIGARFRLRKFFNEEKEKKASNQDNNQVSAPVVSLWQHSI